MIRLLLAVSALVGVYQIHGPWWMYVLIAPLGLTYFKIGETKIL
jgi:hypothetical protein